MLQIPFYKKILNSNQVLCVDPVDEFITNLTSILFSSFDKSDIPLLRINTPYDLP
jgi:hypothetical protein